MTVAALLVAIAVLTVHKDLPLRASIVGLAVGSTAMAGIAFCGLRLATGGVLAPAVVHASAAASATIAAFVGRRRHGP